MRVSVEQFENNKLQKMFTTELVVKSGEENIFFVYRNKGYTAKSKVYGGIFEVTSKNINGVLKFKTKKQVVKFLLTN